MADLESLREWFGAAPEGTRLLLLFLVPHTAASLLLAFGAAMGLPRRYRSPQGWLIAAIFGFAFFLPVIGPAVVGLGALINLVFPSLFHQQVFDRMPVPSYQLSRDAGVGDGGSPRGGDASARLRNPATPIGGRLAALMSMRDAPGRVTGALLREMLADPVEDMRLLAYGMMERRERAVSRQLIRQQELLKQASGPKERRHAARRVAELYWELIYQDLVQGDMAGYALAQAAEHARLALADDDADGPMSVLLARIGLRQGRFDAAASALRAALACRVPEASVLPYLAELHFRAGELDRVREIAVRMSPGAGALDPARRYWSERLPASCAGARAAPAAAPVAAAPSAAASAELAAP